jgi:hypothetical protein
MKEKIIALVLACAAVAAFAQSGDVETYTYLYNNAQTISDQLGILETVVDQGLTNMGDFYVMALRRLISEYSGLRTGTDLAIADSQALILAAALGNEKKTEAAADLRQVAERFNDPFVRSEVMIALGKMKAETHLPYVIRVLNDANENLTLDRLYNERIAFGAIIAIENYGDLSGYLPVYSASVGYYGDWVKEQAVKTLAALSSDPTSFLINVITDPNYNIRDKYAALQSMEASAAPNDQKAKAAVTAISESYRLSTSDVALRSVQRQMRRLAMSMVGNYGTEDAAVYPLLERIYTQGADYYEKIDSVNTLIKLGTDESARILSRFLIDMNTRMRDGRLTNEDRQMTQVLIQSLGAIRSRNGVTALNLILSSDWVPIIKTQAREALRNISENR